MFAVFESTWSNISCLFLIIIVLFVHLVLVPQQTDDEHHEQSDNSHKSLSALTYWVPVYVSLAVMFACVGCVVTMCIYYRNTTKEPENQNKMSQLDGELVDGNGVHKQVAVVHKPNTGVMMLQVPN
eukprot:1017192_1